MKKYRFLTASVFNYRTESIFFILNLDFNYLAAILFLILSTFVSDPNLNVYRTLFLVFTIG